MRIFDENETRQGLDYPSLIEGLRLAHATSDMPQTQCTVISDHKQEENKFITQFSWAHGDVIAIKLNSIFPANATLTPPELSIQGVVVLFEAKTGKVQAVCDGTELTFRKTAADSALAADFLSRHDAQILTLVGSGGLAPHVIEAMRTVRPSLNKILIWNRNYDKARHLAARITNPTCPVIAMENLEEAATQADIISCITMATEPLVQGHWLKQGTHVDLIGAYLPHMREADDEVIRRAGKLFVDTYANCESSGEVAEPLERGILTHEQIVADLFALCQGRHPGRESADEITVYKNVGGGHLDMFAIKHLVSQAMG